MNRSAETIVAVAPREGPRFSVTLLGEAERLSETEWNALARRGFSLHKWHAAAEASGWRARHLVVRDGGAPRAIVPAYLLDGGPASDLHDRWLGPLGPAMAVAGIRLRPTLSVGAPCSATSEWLGDLEKLPENVIRQVLDLLDAQARADGARAIVWPFLDQAQWRLREMARQGGYLDFYAGSTAVLEVQWPSFDDYVARRSKGVRRTVRSDLDWLAARSIHTVTTSDFRVDAERMAALYAASLRHRRGRAPALPVSLFSRLAEGPDAGLWAQLTYQEERLIGSSLSVSAGGVMDGNFAAFAPGFLGGPVYHNDLVYQPLRLACAQGLHHLDLGPTALYPKVLRGGRLRKRLTLVRGMSPLVHEVLRALGPLVARRTEWKERRALAPLGSFEGLAER
jgi:predicted N-acyltransferase